VTAPAGRTGARPRRSELTGRTSLYGKRVNSSLELASRQVRRLGLGTNRLTHTPENVSFIRAAVAAGLEHIDTAHLYTGGQSEVTIGEALDPKPDGVVVATKGGYGGAGQGRPEVLRAQIEESLRNLRVDTIDLYYLHRVDPETPLEESLGAIKECAERGLIRAVGVSSVSVVQIEQARAVLPIAAVQNQYNPSHREHDDVVDYCTREGIVFVPFFPLRGEPRPAEALAWLLRRSPMVLPIPGTLSLSHLQANLAVLDQLAAV
jgi:pyridoxine 4-dehydrogenase